VGVVVTTVRYDVCVAGAADSQRGEKLAPESPKWAKIRGFCVLSWKYLLFVNGQFC